MGAIERSRVYHGDSVWVDGQFAVDQAEFDRKGKAYFYLLRDARLANFKGEKALPIIDVVGMLALPESMIEILRRILAPAGREAQAN